LNWYVVNITSGFEQKIKNTIETTETLREVRKKVIVPISQKSRFYKDKLYNYAEKLYPGYVFIACEDMDKETVFSTVSLIPGILNMADVKEKRRVYAHVPDEEMMVVLQEISSHDDRAEENNENIKIEDRVKVTDGPFSGFEGIVQEIHKATNRETKVKICSSFFSGDINSIVLSISQLELI
jgi:transcriptional antiterminator NusG